MRSILIIYFLIIGINNLFSQGYHVFPVEREITYTDPQGGIFFIKASPPQIIGSDTLYYFNRLIDTSGLPVPDCLYHTNDTSLIGIQYMRLADSTELLFNKTGDTLYFEPQDTIGQEWIFYRYDNGNFIKARYVYPLFGTIIPGSDVEDSLKRIRLEVYDPIGLHLEDSYWWGELFDITKEHGLSKFWDINEFPAEDDTATIRLGGATNPDVGINDINSYDAFNFQPGYEFHYREELAPDDGSEADKRISAWKYFVLNRIDGPSSVTFSMERIKFDTLYFGATPTSSIIWDTIDVTITYSDYAFLDSLEMNLFEFTNFGYSDWQQNDTIFTGIPHKYVYDWYNFDALTDCLSNPDNINQPEQLYGDGLGLMHYQDSTDAENFYKLDLVYFQVGLLEWGTPYDFSDLDLAIQHLTSPQISNIYPNPVNDILTIDILKSGTSNSYKIFSTEGKLVAEGSLVLNTNLLNLEHLSAGLYMLAIHSDSSTEYHQFVKLRD